MKYDNLGIRMKGYEKFTKDFLMERTPVIIRLDGKAFHTFTKGMKKPFDDILINTMQETTKYLCENIQGCVLGYTQSDEISLLLINYNKINTQSWFDNNIQKMCSISASMATLAFNKVFYETVQDNYILNDDYFNKMFDKLNMALFDSRVFTLPKDEVCNYFLWRQNDATRNSIQMVGQSEFSFKELQGKSCNDIQEMLWSQRNINWNNLDTTLKRGSCVIKEQYSLDDDKGTIRNRWVIDNNTPIFSKDRDYIEKYVYIKEMK